MFRYIKKVTKNKFNLNKEIEVKLEYESDIKYVVSNSHIEFFDDEKVKSILYYLKSDLSICERNQLIDKLEKELFQDLDLKIEKTPVLEKDN